jgi:transposase
MNNIIRIGMDTSKHLFQLHGVDADEKVVLRKKLRRKEMIAFFEQLEPTAVGMEACGASHHWARRLMAMGHEAKLMPPQLVKPYVRRNKNDGRDAEGLCEAMSRPTMRFVPVKAEAQQADLMLMNMREELLGARTQLSNRIRSYASEFGVIVPKGLKQIPGLLLHVVSCADIPDRARRLFALYAEDYERLNARLKVIEREAATWHRSNEQSRRLAEIPSVGPVGGSLMTMKAPDPSLFSCGRNMSAWTGLTPKDHTTAGKRKLGNAITRAGDEMLRATLVVGASSLLQQVQRRMNKGLATSPWMASLLKRKSFKEAAVAVANKVMRIAWKLMVSGERFDPKRAPELIVAPAA